MTPPPYTLFLLLLLAGAAAQPLSPSQSKSLLRLQHILEYPAALAPLTPHTDFCSLPPSPSLTLSCSAGRLTTLSVTGNVTSPLSSSFSSDSLFATLARFPALSTLSLISLGLHGPLPSKIDRLSLLHSLNISSNFFVGAIPPELSQLTSLTTLVLSHNSFNTKVLDLTPLSLLSHLDLSSNLLGPNFPSLYNASLVTLILSNNSFRSRIPATLTSFIHLQHLDLSANHLAGPIPKSVFSLPSIHYLDLSRNQLAGELPVNLACSNRLSFVDISNNLLVGSLPTCIQANSSGLEVVSSGNCLTSGDLKYQHPSSYCNPGALAAVLPPIGQKAQSKSKLSLIVGIAAAVVGGAAVLGILLLLVFKRGKAEANRVAQSQKSAVSKAPSPVYPRSQADARHMSQGVRIGTLEVVPYRVFTMEELEEATNYFDQSNCIAEGPKGQFYKGWLSDGSKVLVRCMKLKQKNSPQTLSHYLDVISKLRHCHLVSVLGHCIDNGMENANTTGSVYLLFEYVSNGTLRSHLTEWRKREMLKWRQRVAAVIGVAKGIQFLHTVTVPGIVGNDLSIENILLDETLTAKISNYNLPVLPKNKNNRIDSESPFSLVEDTNIGSSLNLEQGEKKDIYQLGLILLEIITGKPTDSQATLDELKTQLQKSLNEEATKLQEMTDPTIRGTFASESLRTAVELTLNCLVNDPKERPSIDDILWNLQYSVQVQDGWASSENLSTQS